MNQFLTQFLDNARKMWAGLGTGPRVTLISFVGCAILLIVGLTVWSTQTEYVLLYGGLSAEDAAAITTQLRDDKIPCKYEASRGAILVAASKVDTARMNLASKGLPKSGGGLPGFELFDKNTFGATDFQNRINLQRAMEGKLARVIQSYEDIETAQVSLTIPVEDVFSRERQDSKASVMLHVKGSRSLTGENIKAIQHLVASSVPKLDPKSVTVTDSTGRLLSRTSSSGDLSGLNDEQLGMQKSLEDYLANKAQSMLDQTIGRGNSVVRVTALLDLNRVERHTERRDPASVVTLNETIRKDSTETFNATTGGAVGVKPIPGDASGVSSPNKNTSKNSSNTASYGFDLLKEHTVAPVGSIKRLSVAVMISPKSKLPDAPADAPVAARSKKELDDLTASIREAVGFSPDRNDSIKITEVAFETPVLATSTASSSSSALDLVKGHLSDILGFAGVLLMAFIFWRMFSKLTVPVPVVATAKKELIRSMNNVPEARQVTVALSEEVKQLVTENNTQAVNLIRSMIR